MSAWYIHFKTWGWLLAYPTLPLLGVAAGVKAGDYYHRVRLDANEQCIGESAHNRASHVARHNRECEHAFLNTMHRDFELAREPRAEAGGLLFVPILRGNDFRLGGRREEDGQR